jgi:hypothetical protein
MKRLKPARPISVAFAVLLLGEGAVFAADADLQRCRALTDTAARLACYDAIPFGVPGPATAPGAAAAPATGPSGSGLSAKGGDFGIEYRAPVGAPEQIQSRILGFFEGWDRRTLLKLENGQVWQVVDDSRAVIDRRDPVVRISRGALGSFIFEVEGRNSMARVRRVE